MASSTLQVNVPDFCAEANFVPSCVMTPLVLNSIDYCPKLPVWISRQLGLLPQQDVTCSHNNTPSTPGLLTVLSAIPSP